MRIREDVATYMSELKAWLNETENEPLEGMSDFFRARLDSYEEHMRPWAAAYRRVAELVPTTARTLLDIGCGTGLELDEVLKARPDIEVTGVDLSPDMLLKLTRKHPGVQVVEADYFACDFGRERFDMALSFETLHHFPAEQKRGLFTRLLGALKPGGRYLQVDYIACCPEEEALLEAECARRRERDGVPAGRFVHFDTPLTLERETSLMREAGFARVTPLACIDGACFILAEKETGGDR